MAQLVKNLPAMQETWLPPLGWEDPLEEGLAIHSSILAWIILIVVFLSSLCVSHSVMSDSAAPGL